MKPWKYTLDLSDVWGKEWDDRNVHELSAIIADRLETLCGEDFKDDWDFEDIIEGLNQVPTYKSWLSQCVVEPLFKAYPPIEQFDSIWDEFYNWADVERVWVER